MTRAEIARRVGEDPTWVSSRVRGSTEIKGDDIPRLASALGVSARAFFQASPEESPVPTDSRLVRDRLRELLRQRGWTQSELARRLGKHRVWVHYRIKGATEIKADEIPLLAEALGVPPHAFFEMAAPEQSGVAASAPADPLEEPEREFLMGLLDLLDRYRVRMGSGALVSPAPTGSERDESAPASAAPIPVDAMTR
jgi:transcriptional regulator with XRE-family HTH domain